MILVTGGTGFIGSALIRRLVEAGYPVRTLIRPSPHSPRLPRGVSVDVAVSSLTDERGLRAAMVGVDTIYHLASGEWKGPSADLFEIDVRGTRTVVQMAEDAGVKRFFYVSHLGADRASAYPALKSKGIAEEFIRRSSLNYTILRSAIVYGQGDHFTTGLARLLSAIPLFFLMPGDGKVHIQPLWVEYLTACLVWALDDPETENRIIDIGGPEYLSFRQVMELIMQETSLRRRLMSVPPPYLRWLNLFLETTFPSFPVSAYWLDYIAVNRTTALDTLPRVFNLMPTRMSQHLAYLREHNWRASFYQSLRERRI
jgi:NADH dehydrogenase